jgi:hypothetical protein
MSSDWITIDATVGRGYRVASGAGGDPRFPGGTLKLQRPFFAALGLDLSKFHQGTLNVGIAPLRYVVVRPRITFRDVKWLATVPAEDFSFFDVRLIRDGGEVVDGLIYYPHPETKPEHFQNPDVLELLFPFVPDAAFGSTIRIAVPVEQMRLEPDEAGGR